MVTAENTMKMVMGVIEFYPDDYISKPINKDTLKKRIEKLILRKKDLKEIVRLIEKEHFLSAIEKCDEHIATRPRNVNEFIKLKADLSIKLGRYDEAEHIYQSILEERDVPWALFGLGRISYLKGDYAQACEIFERLQASSPNHIESYDWLARCRMKLGERDKAKETLSVAVALSPKVTLRQAFLGDVALQCEDYKLAERAFRSATSAGNRSIFNTPDNYTKLANAMSHTRSPKDVLKALNKIRKDFPQDRNAKLQAEITKSQLLKDSFPEVAKKSITAAKKLYAKLDGNVDTEILLDMSKALYTHNDDEMGDKLLHKVIMNHHDNTDMLGHIQAWMADTGRESQAKELINAAKNHVIKLNNDARDLANAGDLKGADRLLDDALHQSPDNLTINLNSIRVKLKLAESEGPDEISPGKLKTLFDKVRGMNPGHRDLPALMERYQLLLGNTDYENCA
jgi:tetratricopeptide (TPR) repeat protein